MINVKKGYVLCEKHNIPYLNFCKQCEQLYCLLCNETVNKIHYFSKKILIILIEILVLKQDLPLKRNLLILYLIFILLTKMYFIKIYISKIKSNH